MLVSHRSAAGLLCPTDWNCSLREMGGRLNGWVACCLGTLGQFVLCPSFLIALKNMLIEKTLCFSTMFFSL